VCLRVLVGQRSHHQVLCSVKLLPIGSEQAVSNMCEAANTCEAALPVNPVNIGHTAAGLMPLAAVKCCLKTVTLRPLFATEVWEQLEGGH